MTSGNISTFFNLILFLFGCYKSLEDLLIKDFPFSVVKKDLIIVCQVFNSVFFSITTYVVKIVLAFIYSTSIFQNVFVKFNQVSGVRYLSHLLYRIFLKISIDQFLEDIVEFGNTILMRDENAFI